MAHVHRVVTRPNATLFDQLAVIVKIPAATVYIVTRGLMMIVRTLNKLGRAWQR
ncbi:hypothetical protein AND_000081 [Anopheles darlingi]|uniref:Uncharacterized protein n=1 Tax=Anopheles darlingi TaxID=43151 RepID=W5JXC2_ANODA|nr:hypothetical protein AND_000081 [Anopheles darlingi]